MEWIKFWLFQKPRKGYRVHPNHCGPHYTDCCDYICDKCGAEIAEVTGVGGPVNRIRKYPV